MSRTLRFGAAALATAGLLAGCSGNSTGGGQATTPSSAPTTAAQQGQAPQVPAALEVSGLLKDVCSALSTTQLTTIGLLSPGTATQDNTGPTCRWTSSGNDANKAFISPLPVNTGGLSDIYANNSDGRYKYFEPTTIDGYPAAYAATTDDRSTGYCSLWVGVTDQLAVFVNVQIPEGANKTNPCPIAEKVAKGMIEHLKGAA